VYEYVDFVFEHWGLIFLVFMAIAVVIVSVYDVFLQRTHSILHNFPFVGHGRYLLEMLGPELRQYLVANDTEERPFNRRERSWIYASAKGVDNTTAFGTEEDLIEEGYHIVKHAAFPLLDNGGPLWDEDDPTAVPSLKTIGRRRGRRRPYRPPSVVNVSAMSYGSLGRNAVAALNKGALLAPCSHNTGEGGISPYHTSGADLVWQIGTGYFGARTPDGRFSYDMLLARVEEHPYIRCIEIKLSQGAKAGKGGMLPGKKVTREIAEIRGVPVGVDCISPSAHTEFRTVDELIDFIERIADLTGLPVGIKSAVGELGFWHELAIRIKERGEGPDFITIDGGEGGTGATPLTFADHVALPFRVGFARVYRVFKHHGVASEVVWIGSAKLGFPHRAVLAFALGCDLVNVAREAMMAIGCVQAQKCHTNRCPTGVATQNWWLQAGLNVEEKARRLASYIRRFRGELLDLARAAGYSHPCQFEGKDIEVCVGPNEFANLDEVVGYKRDPIVPEEGFSMELGRRSAKGGSV